MMKRCAILLPFVLLLATKAPLTAAPHRKSGTTYSFAFVIDKTASNEEEMLAVKMGLKTLLDRNVAYITEYILVPFGDPNFGPTLKSADKKLVKKEVENLKTESKIGRDCPEMAMSGLLEAIKASKPYSFIFFFSDATAKDLIKRFKVIRQANKKRLKIFLVVTGCCSNCKSRSFKAYKEVADRTGGVLYHVGKSKVAMFMEYLEYSAAASIELLRNPPHNFKDIEKMYKSTKPMNIDHLLNKGTAHVVCYQMKAYEKLLKSRKDRPKAVKKIEDGLKSMFKLLKIPTGGVQSLYIRYLQYVATKKLVLTAPPFSKSSKKPKWCDGRNVFILRFDKNMPHKQLLVTTAVAKDKKTIVKSVKDISHATVFCPDVNDFHSSALILLCKGKKGEKPPPSGAGTFNADFMLVFILIITYLQYFSWLRGVE